MGISAGGLICGGGGGLDEDKRRVSDTTGIIGQNENLCLKK